MSRGTSGAESSGGVVLGAAVSRPLTVSVVVKDPLATTTISTRLTYGSPTEALAHAAAALGGEFTYLSRGSSIYLKSFMHYANDANGAWLIDLNGRPLSDLSLAALNQGDTLTVTRQ